MSTSVRRLSPDVWDDLDAVSVEVPPLWSIKDVDNRDDVELWFEKAVTYCQDYYRRYFQVQMDNLLLFKGVQWLSQERYGNRFLDRQGVATRKSPKIVINHLYDFTEQWVSRLTRYKPAVKVYPSTSDYTDEQNASVGQAVLDYNWYLHNADQLFQKFARQLKIFGEAYLWTLWDPTKGDYHPDYLKQQQIGAKTPVLGPNGEPVLSEAGDPLFINTAQRIGELDYCNDAPWHTWDMPCRNRKDIDWAIRWYTRPVEYMKAKYPEYADKIKADAIEDVFDQYRLDIGKARNEVIVYELWHRSMEFLDKGRFIKRIKGCVLENVDHPFSHRQIPYVYCNDIEVPDEIRGMSFYQQLFPVTHQINAVASLIFKALVLYAHPKIMMPDGCCEIQQLINDNTIISYTGDIGPSLMTMSPITGELFTYLDKLEATAEKMSGVFTMSRGNAPSGVRAARALRVLEEQEDKRSYITITKFNQDGIVGNAKQTLSTYADMIDDADGRLAKIMGQNNEMQILNFNKTDISKPFEVRILSTTALSQSPAAKIEDVESLANLRIDPEQSLFSREEIHDFLNIGNDEKMKTIATQAIRCAESEMQDLLAGKQIPLPTPDEDLILHWRVQERVAQTRTFKERIPPEIKQAYIQHQMATEYLMFEKGMGIRNEFGQLEVPPSPAFQMEMSKLKNFPMYFKMPSPEVAMGPPPGMGPPMPGEPAPGTMPPGGAMPPQEPQAQPAPEAAPMPQPNTPQGLPLE